MVYPTVREVEQTIARLKRKGKQKLNLAARLLEKQLMLLKLEEILILSTFVVGGALGRAAMQGFPSIEPITFFAVLSGFLFGRNKGAAAGAASWWLSNWLVLGGQGPWSIIHVMSGAVAGYLGGVLRKPGYVAAVAAVVAATIVFELSMNVASGFFFGFGVILSFITAAPFALIHIASNAGMALLIPRTYSLVKKSGRLDEKGICKELIALIKRRKDEKPA
jgi:hypothetical protein